MFLTTKQSQRSVLMIIDLIAVVISFFAAVYTRFYKESDWQGINSWNNGLYYLLLELVLAINIVVFLLNDSKHRPIYIQNPLEKLINVIKNNLIQTVFLVLMLYLIKQGIWASRAVVLALFIYNVCLDFLFRFIYGRFLYREIKKNSRSKNIMLLSSLNEADVNTRRFKASLGSSCSLSGVIVFNNDDKETPLPDEISGVKVVGAPELLSDKYICSDIDEIYYYSSDKDETGTVLRRFDELGISLNIIPSFSNAALSADVFEKNGNLNSFRLSFMKEKNDILGVKFVASNIWEAAWYIRQNIAKLRGKYICFSNVHTTVMARENPDYRQIQNNAAFVFPDGAPIAKIQQLAGNQRAIRIAGPDFMKEIFLSSVDGGLSMYFYGSSQTTIDSLKKNIEKKYPGLDVRGYESPPFRNLTTEEDAEVIRRINESGADLVWIGLGAPKQEIWMNEHSGKINALMLGVGAGFDFHAGTVRRAPEWMQHVGLEWLFRLFQDPKRLIRRYFVTNIKFAYYLLTEKLGGHK